MPEAIFLHQGLVDAHARLSQHPNFDLGRDRFGQGFTLTFSLRSCAGGRNGGFYVATCLRAGGRNDWFANRK
jgi:hypothetical protein